MPAARSNRLLEPGLGQDGSQPTEESDEGRGNLGSSLRWNLTHSRRLVPTRGLVFRGIPGEDFNKLLGFRADDGWCVKGVQSIGSHCFGDYAIFDKHFDEGKFWGPDADSATAYPPLSIVPMLAFLYLGRITGSWALGRDLYLLLLAGSLLSPALWVSRRSWTERGPTSLLIIGLATAPFLVVLDRGNSTGLVVAPLLGAAIAYANERYGRMVIFIVICVLLKPQMILLALLFFFYRKYSYFTITVATSVVLRSSAFSSFPGSPRRISSTGYMHSRDIGHTSRLEIHIRTI